MKVLLTIKLFSMLKKNFLIKMVKRRIKAKRLTRKRDKVLYNMAFVHGIVIGALFKPVLFISHVDIDMLVGNAEKGVKICHTNNERNKI